MSERERKCVVVVLADYGHRVCGVSESGVVDMDDLLGEFPSEVAALEYAAWKNGGGSSPTSAVVPTAMEPLLGSLAELRRVWEIDKGIKDYTRVFHRAMEGVLGHLADLPACEPLAEEWLDSPGPFMAIHHVGYSIVAWTPGDGTSTSIAKYEHKDATERRVSSEDNAGRWNAEYQKDPKKATAWVKSVVSDLKAGRKPDYSLGL